MWSGFKLRIILHTSSRSLIRSVRKGKLHVSSKEPPFSGRSCDSFKAETGHNLDLEHSPGSEIRIENVSPPSCSAWPACFLRSAPCWGVRGETGAAAPRWSRSLHSGWADPAGSEQEGAPSDPWPLPGANTTCRGRGEGQRSRSAGCSHRLRSESWLGLERQKKKVEMVTEIFFLTQNKIH